MMIRNINVISDGLIDCEINHPVYGWIPFTASASDPEKHGRDIYELVSKQVSCDNIDNPK